MVDFVACIEGPLRSQKPALVLGVRILFILQYGIVGDLVFPTSKVLATYDLYHYETQRLTSIHACDAEDPQIGRRRPWTLFKAISREKNGRSFLA